MAMTICCACDEHYGGDALACAQSRPLECPDCKWSGTAIRPGFDAVQAVIDWGKMKKDCPTCHGSGKIAATWPCACDCHDATHETVSLPKGRLEWLERCEKAIQSMAGQFCSPVYTPEQMVADALGEPHPPGKKRASR